MKSRKVIKIKSSEHLIKEMKKHVVVSLVIWSDGSATITMGWDTYDLDVSMDIWEDFNLKYNFYDYA